MRKVVWALVVCMLAVPAMADQTASYGWESGGTVLGRYSDITAFTSCDPVHSGDNSLRLIDQAASGTPQAYVAWIIGLQDGDSITADFWRYDTTPSGAPSCRIWGHYTSDESDIDSYAGSASGNSSYGALSGWDNLSYTWVFDGSDPTRNGLVVEARTYSNPGDTVWIDDITVTAPDHATIILVPEPVSIALFGLGALALVRRRR